MFRKKLFLGRARALVAKKSKCAIAIEACATAHGWDLEFEKFGHDVRLIPTIYVKPFV